MSRVTSVAAFVAVLLYDSPAMRAQSAVPLEFDVVSIKPNTSGPGTPGGIRTLPDGTYMMVNQPIRAVILRASPVQTREVVGLPNWVTADRYDITAKPPAGSTPEQLQQMWRALFADRMKLMAHVEQQERNTFALVLARADGRLGPQLKPSTLDCGPRPPGSPPPPPPQAPLSPSDFQNRCGFGGTATSMVSGGTTMDILARSLVGRVGGLLVTDRTGLQGFYAFTLTFSLPRGVGSQQDAASVNDAPEIFTALQEQLGLKLQPEKMVVPVFVIDHIERPSEN